MRKIRPARSVALLLSSLIVLMIGAPVSALAALQPEQIVASADGVVSVHLPSGWVAATRPATLAVSTTLVFAHDQAALDAAMHEIDVGVTPAAAPGANGLVTILTPQAAQMLGADSGTALTTYLSELTKTSADPMTALTINQVFQNSIEGGSSEVMDVSTSAKLNSRGYVGGMAINHTLIIFQLTVSPASQFDGEAPIFQQIATSIRVPAEAGAVKTGKAGAEPTPLVPILVTAAPTLALSASPAGGVSLRRSSGDLLSLELPDGWSLIDRAVEQNVVAYGDTEAAAQSRLDTIVAPSAGTAPTPITGNGGVVVLYWMADYGVDPNAPDLKPLFDRLLGGLLQRGYQVISGPQTIDLGGGQGEFVVVSGGEYGFLALVPFGDQIVYVTATSIPRGLVGNEPMANQLIAVLQSVRVPAEPAASA